RHSRLAPLIEITDKPLQSDPYISGNARRAVGACHGTLELVPADPTKTAGGINGSEGTGGGVRLNIQSAMALRLRLGDLVRFVSAKPARVKEEVADGNEVALY